MTIDLTQIILAVITLIFALISRYAIPYAKSKLDDRKMELLRIAVQTAVYAAEQLYNSDQGKEKKEYVINLLKEYGYVVDPEKIEPTLNALIEAMVRELHIEQGEKDDKENG